MYDLTTNLHSSQSLSSVSMQRSVSIAPASLLEYREHVARCLSSYGVPDQLPCSTAPISPWAFFQQVSENRDICAVKRLPLRQAALYQWLFQNHYLTRQPDSTPGSIPEISLTAQGCAAGFILQDGQLLCSTAGQRLLAEHLDELLELSVRRWITLREQALSGSLDTFLYSREPLILTQLVRKILARLPDGDSISPSSLVRAISHWLEWEEYLTWNSKRTRRIPTPKGDALGITVGPYPGKSRWAKNEYSLATQQFLLKHLPQILWEERISLVQKQNKTFQRILSAWTPGQLSSSRSPMGVNRFVSYINQAAQTQLSPKVLVDWLTQKGFLTYAAQNQGERRLIPTEFGYAIGSYLVPVGNSVCTVFDQNAQQFILDHMPQILEEYQAAAC